MQTREEAHFRMRLAEEHLEKAKEELQLYDQDRKGRHLAACIASSQASVENSAKAVISCFGVPSKVHDTSSELLLSIQKLEAKLGEDLLKKLEKVARFSHVIAPEHFRSVYGDEERGILPSELYTRGEAKEFLQMAEFSYTVCKAFLEWWFK